MSMRTLLSEVRTALTSYSDLTNLIPADKITFARRPQRDEMPGMTFAIGNVDYDETKTSFAASTSYRVDITAYCRSADQATDIHDKIKLALLAADSSVFDIRILDERYFVDVDNNHMAYVSCTWRMGTSLTTSDTTILSPAFQGSDRMKFKSNLSMANGGTTTLDLDTHGYALNFATHNGAASHTIIIPAAVDYMGKMYTFVFGNNIDNNSVVVFDPVAGRMEGSNTYTVDRGTSSMTVVAVENPSGVQQWRIIAYKGLHD